MRVDASNRAVTGLGLERLDRHAAFPQPHVWRSSWHVPCVSPARRALASISSSPSADSGPPRVRPFNATNTRSVEAWAGRSSLKLHRGQPTSPSVGSTTSTTSSLILRSLWWRGIGSGATGGHDPRESMGWHPAPSSSGRNGSLPGCEMISRLGGSGRFRCGNGGSPSPAGNCGPWASRPPGTGSCRPPSSWCSNRSSRRTSGRVLTASARGAGPRTPSLRSTTSGSAPRNYCWVLEADIKACFDEIDHTALLGRVRLRIGDRRVLDLVKAFLKAGVLGEDVGARDTITGTPQGGILSPSLANIALSVLDDHFVGAWEAMGDASARHRRRRTGLATD